MNKRMTDFFMSVAHDAANMSRAQRLQVGAVIVQDDEDIIGYGWNGTPRGWDNNCEDKKYMNRDAGGWLNPDELELMWPLTEIETSGDFAGESVRYKLVTKPEVLHAESNALAKVMRSTRSAKGATMFVTHAPCLECSKIMSQAGITKVVYEQDYRDSSGVEYLQKCGVEVCKT